MTRGLIIFSAGCFLFLFSTCRTDDKPTTTNQPPVDKLFTSLPSAYTGVDFINHLEYTEDYNPYTFRNFFNGGGVGLGDINNDGLIDLFFCGNLVDNKLYLNKGNFRFEDITEQAGVAAGGAWTSGVSLADVNGDGRLDIYLCKSGDPKSRNRRNELFINNGDLTFTEMAEEYGIADLGLSVHAAFFDYDRDGDLDCYLLNNSIRSVGGYDLIKDQRERRDPLGGNKLYRHDGDHFTDVSEEAGIYGSDIGFGLGVTIGDVNKDGWPDIYVSNDFFERDYLYINNADGTFSEDLESQIREISMGSMGADMADINNDGFPEIFVTEMLPEKEDRIKTKTVFETWDKYQMNVKNGYYHQFTRNVLQLNNGDGTFSEISRLAGVSATDWSWGALIFDLNNDGLKDIFVANGIRKDLMDLDYVNFYSDPGVVRSLIKEEKKVITTLIDAIPSEKLPNYAFVNLGNLTFENQSDRLGLAGPSFSNGSAYGDLDNDGDLDLVTNNIDMPPFLFRNETDTLLKGSNHFLSIELTGEGKNRFALGAQVTAWKDGLAFYQEQNPMRGFQSTVDHRLHFGLGSITELDSLQVSWPDGMVTILKEIPADQFLRLHEREAAYRTTPGPGTALPSTVFKEITEQGKLIYHHRENEYVDFDRDRLIYHMISAEGPCICKGDVNGDGREDVYIGGAKDRAGSLFLQDAAGRFQLKESRSFEEDKRSEDTDCLFFDADRDGDPDLYVTSGGNEFSSTSTALRDRLYFNDGRGNFSRSDQFLPVRAYEHSSCVQAADFDLDGDADLFVGTRMRPSLYGVPVNGYILENDGKGIFKDRTDEVAPGLKELGMITDALWTDHDGDGDPDLIVVGEWMPITIFTNEGGRLTNTTAAAGLAQTQGFWNCLKTGDFDGDGDPDFVIGNHGKNTRIKAAPDQPATLYVNDFDGNGTAEQIICTFNEGQSYPLVLRHDLVMQMPYLKKKYLKYEDYKKQTVGEIFTPEQLSAAIRLEARYTGSSIAVNQGDGTFVLQELPLEAQFAPVYSLLVDDFDGDGRTDMLLGGNFYRSKPEIGIYDAGYGLFLKGEGNNRFSPLPAKESGFRVIGEMRDLLNIESAGERIVLVALNNSELKVFAY